MHQYTVLKKSDFTTLFAEKIPILQNTDLTKNINLRMKREIPLALEGQLQILAKENDASPFRRLVY